ncbi:MAG: hypothetical protein ACF8GE_08935 [Phycisphaerales bacterium JB043]
MGQRSLMHNLGSFFGHIARGIRAPVSGRDRVEIRRDVEERRAQDASGHEMTLRRTTIEEIEYTHTSEESNGSQHA